MKCKEALKKRIDVIRDQQNYQWSAIFITGGGGLTIALSNPHSYLALSLGFIGLLMSGMFIKHFFLGQKQLSTYITKLKDLEENP